MSTIKTNNVFNGYSNFRDITNMPQTKLAAGSLNTILHDGEKIEPRAGMDYLGAAGSAGTQTNAYWTLAHRIHSNYDDFVNLRGVKIPLRVFYSGNTTDGDVLEAYLPVGGIIPSGGVLNSTPKQWYQITPDVWETSAHRYYWAEWWDPINLQSRLVFTKGKADISSWSGAFVPIASKTPTTLTISGGTWQSYGFISLPYGNASIVIDGVEYALTAGDFSTNTITLGSTAGISVGDIAFQMMEASPSLGTTIFDVCAAINNQIYYIDWNQRNVYVSWNRNQGPSLGLTIFSGVGLDDAAFSGTYTDTVRRDYKVIINSVQPNIDTQEFVSTGNGINDGSYITSLYSGTAGATNTYRIVVVGDITFQGTISGGTISAGHILKGANGEARVVKVYAGAIVGAVVLSGYFTQGETLTDLTSTGITLALNSTLGWFYNSWIQAFKNDVNFTITTTATGDIVPIGGVGSFALTDGLSFIFGNISGHAIGDYWLLTIRRGGVDTFQWSDGGALSGSVVITGLPQALSHGITIKFSSLIGHTVGDSWSVIATQQIIQGWANFTYDNPRRLPGQGFTLLLDSNGWTMKPQEHTMLINAQAGHFYDATVKLSSDLLGETIEVVRLKSEPQNKILFPYLLNYIKNQLATISQDKTFDLLGRQKFLELQQTKTLSDEVRIDFETSDWEDADVRYFKRKIYFCLPKMGLIFIYDDYKKYWHSPQQFGKRISLLSIIDDKLIGHSYEQNESYELFTGLNDLGIFPIKTRMVFPYESFGKRLEEKTMSNIGFEGYILGNPIIKYTINSGIGGCSGRHTGQIKPFMCVPTDTASLGKSSLGFHGLGNNPVNIIPHFFYIEPFDNLQFYQRNIEIECDSLEQRWSLISLGTDVDMAGINSVSITDRN